MLIIALYGSRRIIADQLRMYINQLRIWNIPDLFFYIDIEINVITGASNQYQHIRLYILSLSIHT